MKLSTLKDMLVTGQFSLLLGLRNPTRQYYRSTFLAAALREGLLSFLREQPATLEQIHQRLIGPGTGVSRERLQAWLDLGVMLGELRLTADRCYTLGSRTARQLAQPSNDPAAALFEEVCTLHHDLITQTPSRLREGRLFQLADTPGELIARSSRILESYIFEIMDEIVPQAGAIRLLEIGCGSGVYIRRACQRNPELSAVGLELQDEVAEFARQNLRAWGLAERVRVECADVRNFASPEPFDLITLHNNIYYFPVMERLDLLCKLGSFLNPGGRLVVTTACQGSPSTQALHLWGLMTEGMGPLPRAEELRRLIVQAEFRDIRQTALQPGENFFAFVGKKE
ncbi:MAG TPA: class I SAM-dependent methyltransferase [Anaerolineaceae bacterium]|nr:class I SAM-dependent methyltransferase [Anaerolineaceae bacterium]